MWQGNGEMSVLLLLSHIIQSSEGNLEEDATRLTRVAAATAAVMLISKRSSCKDKLSRLSFGS